MPDPQAVLEEFSRNPPTPPHHLLDPVLVLASTDMVIGADSCERLELINRIDRALLDQSGALADRSVQALAWDHDKCTPTPLRHIADDAGAEEP
jgi:hypothetical protein